ncbi:hypothetical protein ACL58G_29075 [Massilia sp. GER05]|uniref:hypothetical protein n=1 Tax=Massilia sp. GER05 TaxID=3394605 RepID=UPI003F84ED7C
MRKILIMLATASVLGGCASASLPGCDGSERRPINVPSSAQAGYPSCSASA